MNTPDKQTLPERLLSATVKLRTTPVTLAVFIPLLQEAADALDAASLPVAVQGKPVGYTTSPIAWENPQIHTEQTPKITLEPQPEHRFIYPVYTTPPATQAPQPVQVQVEAMREVRLWAEGWASITYDDPWKLAAMEVLRLLNTASHPAPPAQPDHIAAPGKKVQPMSLGEAAALLLAHKNGASPRPQPVTQELTDEQIDELAGSFQTGRAYGDIEFARAIEAAHGIGITPATGGGATA